MSLLILPTITLPSDLVLFQSEPPELVLCRSTTAVVLLQAEISCSPLCLSTDLSAETLHKRKCFRLPPGPFVFTHPPLCKAGAISAANPSAFQHAGVPLPVFPTLITPREQLVLHLMFKRCPDKFSEQWMCLRRTGFQLGVKLTADKPGMIRDLSHFNKLAVR